MARNQVNGNNTGVQAGTIHGDIDLRGGGSIEITDATADGHIVNITHGDMNGVQAGVINGGIRF